MPAKTFGVKFRVVVNPRIGVRLMGGALGLLDAQLEARRFADLEPQIVVDLPYLREAERAKPLMVGVPCRSGPLGVEIVTGWVFPERKPRPQPAAKQLAPELAAVLGMKPPPQATSPVACAIRTRPAFQTLGLLLRIVDAFRRLLSTRTS